VGRWLACAAAAIFLAHPIQTEAVLYVYQRSILLACFFSLLGLLMLAERRFSWAAIMLLCAFESKESAIAAPVAVALLGGLFLKWLQVNLPPSGVGKRLRITLFVAGILLAAAALGLLLYMDERTAGLGAAEHISPLRYLLTETRVVFTYLRLLFFPYSQS